MDHPLLVTTDVSIGSLAGWGGDGWRGLRVVVAGLGPTGFSAADTLVELGAEVLVAGEAGQTRRRELLGVIGAEVVDVDAVAQVEAFEPALVIAPAEASETDPVLRWAGERGIPVWGDVELAWRVRDKVVRADGTPVEWMLVTGSEGVAATARLAATMLVTGGLRAAPCSATEVSALDAVRDPAGFDVLVVELTEAELRWFGGVIAPLAAVCLDGAGRGELLGRVYENVRVACVYNLGDEATRTMVEDAEVQEGARAIGFGATIPGPSDVGVVEGLLVDRAFLDDRRNSALELATLDDLLAAGLDSPQDVRHVLAASALARAGEARPVAIRDAIRGFSR